MPKNPGSPLASSTARRPASWSSAGSTGPSSIRCAVVGTGSRREVPRRPDDDVGPGEHLRGAGRERPAVDPDHREGHGAGRPAARAARSSARAAASGLRKVWKWPAW